MKKINSEMFVSFSAMITAVVAVSITVAELKYTREYQRLSVEPYLSIGFSNNNIFEYSLKNNGSGPGRIKGINVNVDGNSVSSWREVVQLLTDIDNPMISFAGLWIGRQIRPGENLPFLSFKNDQQAKLFQKERQRLKINICYCSLYKDCWIIRNGAHQPKVVEQCPSSKADTFPSYR